MIKNESLMLSSMLLLNSFGSVTKTFTGLTLARMVEQQKVRLDEPVRELLPPGTVTKPTDSEITLLDLATHHSGLPPMPDNLGRAGNVNRYTDYGPQQLYAYLASHGLAKPVDATFIYSNLGVGLLGQALANRSGKKYADQLRDEITGPLGMTDTVLKPSGVGRNGRIPNSSTTRTRQRRALRGMGTATTLVKGRARRLQTVA